MTQISIIQRGVVIGTWNVSAPVQLLEKFQLMCKEQFQTAVWADHGRSISRKIDPAYVCFRSSRRKSSDLVLVNVDEAPENYLEELKIIYKW